MCGKTSPLYGKKTTLKSLHEVSDLALISARRCIGRGGFVRIKNAAGVDVEPVPLSSRLSDPVCLRLANELIDLSSGLLTIVWENNVPVTMPSLLKKMQRLSDGAAREIMEDEDRRFKVDDYARGISSLEAENKRLLDWKESASLRIADYESEVFMLTKQVGEVTQSDDCFRLQHDDLVRENNRLREENNRLRKDLHYRDEVIRMYENRSLM